VHDFVHGTVHDARELTMDDRTHGTNPPDGREPDDTPTDGSSPGGGPAAAPPGASGTGPDESDLHNVQDDDASGDEDRFDAG